MYTCCTNVYLLYKNLYSVARRMNSSAEIKTIPQLLRNVVKTIHPGDTTFLLEKVGNTWQEISYKQTLDYADALSSYFLDIGIQKGDRLALIIENSPEYVYYDQGLQQIGAINVSIYPTLSEHEIEYILNDSGARTILVGNAFLLKKILKITTHCPALELIIPVFDDFEKHVAEHPVTAQIVSFNSLIAKGRLLTPSKEEDINQRRASIQPADVSTLIYTAGTTGIPKGVMLTHNNFVENIRVCINQMKILETTDVFLSFLPLSHVYERTATYYVCCTEGCKIAFAQSIELLPRNLIEVKPTIFMAVPRLLERIHDKAIKNGTAGGGIKARIFVWSLGIGRKYRLIKESGKAPGLFLSLQQKIAEKLVFSKIKEKTGGRLKFIISGGAALPKTIGEFFGDLGIKILEGFGLTETSPVMTFTQFERQVYGTVGRVIPGIEIGIQNPETKEFITVQDHYSYNPEFTSEEGEIVVRGHCVMKGYWNKPEETAQVIDTQGWFHTGDIGRFYKGYLQITDRIKNILVNSLGKNIYPTPVENTYLKSQKIEQIFLIGDKREYITAIIVPPKELLQEKFSLTEDFFQKSSVFIEDPEIIHWISEDIKKISVELSKFERIKRFKVKRNPFSIEAGEITPTMKTKRKEIERKYAEEIDKMYMQDFD